MRLLLLLALIGCTDAADVPTTVVHINVSATCTSADCYPYLFDDDCGPNGSTAITPGTRSVTVLTDEDADKIDAYVELQYTSADSSSRVDQVLVGNESVEVYSAYDFELLYRITSTGDIVDIDTTRLKMASGNTLHFEYAGEGLTAQEDHVIDAPIPVHLETDNPGLMDACCSAGRPREGLLVALALVFVRRRRRAT